MNMYGILCAFAASALFGVATPLAKLLLDTIDPWALAGLFYLGSGAGLGVVRLLTRRQQKSPEAPLRRADVPWFVGAILFGGVIGPILLMLGLQRTDAATTSLLLTLEGVATALIAWFVFRENVDRRIAFGMSLIIAGAVVLAWRGSPNFDGAIGPLAIVGASVAWGIDNNLTRRVSLADPLQIAMLKGLAAGPVTLALAFANGASLPAFDSAVAAAAVGFFGYGISLVLFILALRHLGTARTGAYFSTAPFLGVTAAILLLGEAPSIQLLVAGGLMAFGLWLHLTERHAHEHEHSVVEHDHRHGHDEHHAHSHKPADPPGEPHNHRHRHVGLRHGHGHVPDSHHRHGH
jgi:drug/metabolite transporter (DMT)-like permease